MADRSTDGRVDVRLLETDRGGPSIRNRGRVNRWTRNGARIEPSDLLTYGIGARTCGPSSQFEFDVHSVWPNTVDRRT